MLLGAVNTSHGCTYDRLESRFFMLGKVSIDGDMFGLTIPSVSQIVAYKDYIIHKNMKDEWYQLWKKLNVTSVFCQECDNGRPYLCEVSIHHIFESVFYSRPMSIFSTDERTDTVLFPVLIPLTRNGEKYDMSACCKASERTVTWGGSLLVDGVIRFMP